MVDDENRNKNSNAAKAEFINPPNMLKTKVGADGLNATVLDQAQKLLEKNSSMIDFRPIAEMYLNSLLKAIDKATHEAGKRKDREILNDICEPVFYLKANGKMFGYKLITEMAEKFILFLNSIDRVDGKSLEIMHAFHTSMSAVVRGEIKGEGGVEGQNLMQTLQEACVKYIDKQTLNSSGRLKN